MIFMYKGPRGRQAMRSASEVTWARVLDAMGWSWHYEPRPEVPKGADRGFLPDFLVERDIRGKRIRFYLEVKAGEPLDRLVEAARRQIEGSRFTGRICVVGDMLYPTPEADRVLAGWKLECWCGEIASSAHWLVAKAVQTAWNAIHTADQWAPWRKRRERPAGQLQLDLMPTTKLMHLPTRAEELLEERNLLRKRAERHAYVARILRVEDDLMAIYGKLAQTAEYRLNPPIAHALREVGQCLRALHVAREHPDVAADVDSLIVRATDMITLILDELDRV